MRQIELLQPASVRSKRNPDVVSGLVAYHVVREVYLLEIPIASQTIAEGLPKRICQIAVSTRELRERTSLRE